jgi:hypothetical protein
MSSIKLPDGIDYLKYNNDSGMSTKHWGPAAWKFLFTSIMGRYPFKIEMDNTEHILIKNAFKNMLTTLQIVMPCIYCRESFKKFLLELPIEPFLSGRIELMYWLYLMKDKVNNKLQNQENKCYTDEKRKLKSLFYNGLITQEEYYTQVKEFKEETFHTIPTPPFEEVLNQYESLRAVCSDKAKTCALPKKTK